MTYQFQFSGIFWVSSADTLMLPRQIHPFGNPRCQCDLMPLKLHKMIHFKNLIIVLLNRMTFFLSQLYPLLKTLLTNLSFSYRFCCQKC